ncbi:MAG: hypothetical protein QNJ60_15465 [Xenococcaceae cyanobacterium MO_188.B19]|nr:hypothetical protein [Xenococcaceae cyanobacterium MO_188.B19]
MTSKVIITSTNYPERTLKRAERALYCSPFRLNLFAQMRDRSISLQDIATNSGIEKNYTKKAIAESQAESYLMWLLKVGVLRREVDGQGLTDSFRLTPLGRQNIEKWQQQGEFPVPSLKDRISNWLNRWLQWSF